MRILRYHITLKGQFQEVEGELTLQVDRTDVSGSVNLDGSQSYFQGKMLRKNRYAASMRLKTKILEEDCDMLLRLCGQDAIRGSIVGEWGDWTLEGAIAAPPPGETAVLNGR